MLSLRKAKEPEIKDKEIRNLVQNLRNDLSPYHDGRLEIQVVFPEEKEHGNLGKPTVNIVNVISLGFLGANSKSECVFSINDGPTGFNYVDARYQSEELRHLIELRARDYEATARIKVRLERYSDGSF